MYLLFYLKKSEKIQNVLIFNWISDILDLMKLNKLSFIIFAKEKKVTFELAEVKHFLEK